jgi:hypothetical protein
VRGAAAAALYGQRAASGVIVIKTNRGERAPSGTTRITATSEAGFSKLARRIPLASSHRYLVDQQGRFIDLFGRPVEGRAYVFDPDQIIDNKWGIRTYDHEMQMFGTGPSLSNNLSISQSSLSTNFNVQVGSSNESGILKSPRGGIERYNIRMNLDHRVGDKLTLGFGTYYNRQYQKIIGDNSTKRQRRSTFSTACTRLVATSICSQPTRPATSFRFPTPRTRLFQPDLRGARPRQLEQACRSAKQLERHLSTRVAASAERTVRVSAFGSQRPGSAPIPGSLNTDGRLEPG